MKIRPHKFGSVVARLGLHGEVDISRMIEARSGQVLVVRALEEKRVYDQLELTTGRLAHVGKGDVIVGALGRRDALRGFVGRVPDAIAAGDVLHLLNLGGVLGKVVSENQDVGHPLRVEVLGMVLADGRGANIADGALQVAPSEGSSAVTEKQLPPVIAVSGTCMNSGKTYAACEIISGLTARGYTCGGVKLTGVAALRDTLNMSDHGAVATGSFVDMGLPSTAGVKNVAPVANDLIAAVARDAQAPLDVIVAEMGDGIIGAYGVASILADDRFREQVVAHVLCANDLVAAWGGQRWFAASGLSLDIIAGPATDNTVGLTYVADELGVVAANARADAEHFVDQVERAAFIRGSRGSQPAKTAAENLAAGSAPA
ncbi:MAG: hypothetical protein ACI9EF_000544 [Pseudohongiellaceae bacterium]|jgi:hypothetical protein